MQPTLIIMAAGLGSRFGGVKQIARVGPGGEAILDFSIKDGLAAGFGDVVIIVRAEIEQDVRHHLGELHRDVPIAYVCQDDLGPPRQKPWGTLHAVLSAASAVEGPFAVINADDYYGPSSFSLAARCLGHIEAGLAVNVAFELGHTVPPAGAVTRAVTAVTDGYLSAIVETDGCERLTDGTYSAGGEIVPPTTPVSMNLWCFDRSAFDEFDERWHAFYQLNAGDPKAECQLPTVVGELVAADRMKVKVVASTEQWIGITNPDDFELARKALAHR
ncbi:MAG: NTP transferase domain-containing protein [Actinomycetia bacterium]|nr:NTP transferase domain-containing protein [Actinomycetes bacterium]MCP5030450.1 NTP transferase domain-containing protein [Actinomycetes bacterium]